MKPRKFYYSESSSHGHAYSIEWKNDRLELRQSPCIIHDFDEVEATVKPSNKDWSNFEQNVKDLKMVPVEPEYLVCDGTVVDVWITFRYRLIKFCVIHPEFEKYDQFRDLINELTVCPKYPRGLFKFDPYEILQAHGV